MRSIPPNGDGPLPILFNWLTSDDLEETWLFDAKISVGSFKTRRLYVK